MSEGYVDKVSVKQAAILKQLKESGRPVHRRELSEAVGGYQLALRVLLYTGAVRSLGCGWYEDGSLPLVNAETAAVDAIREADRPLQAGELAQRRIASSEVQRLADAGVLRRTKGAFALPRATKISAASLVMEAVSQGPRSVGELLEMEGVSRPVLNQLVHVRRLQRRPDGLLQRHDGKPRPAAITSRIKLALECGPRTARELAVTVDGANRHLLDQLVYAGRIRRLAPGLYAKGA